MATKTLRKTTVTSSKPSAVRVQRARLECRISTTVKQKAEEAATLLGQDLTAFTESALNEKAEAVIKREEKLIMSKRDFAIFVEAIENPKPVGARLKAAAEEYKTVRRNQPELNW